MVSDVRNANIKVGAVNKGDLSPDHLCFNVSRHAPRYPGKGWFTCVGQNFQALHCLNPRRGARLHPNLLSPMKIRGLGID